MLYILSYDRLLLGTATTSCPKRSFRSPLTLLSVCRIIHPFQLFFPVVLILSPCTSATLTDFLYIREEQVSTLIQLWLQNVVDLFHYIGKLTFKNSDIHKSMTLVLLVLQLCRIFMAHVCCVQVFAASVHVVSHIKRFVTVNRGSFTPVLCTADLV